MKARTSKFYSSLRIAGIFACSLANAGFLLDEPSKNSGFFTESSDLSTLQGYIPTVLPSEETAKNLYDRLPTTQFRSGSGCFQRAHVWSYSLYQSQNIKSMKVFIYFTQRYKWEFDYEWDYHVAPLIPVRMNDGSIQELVFDPTFTSSGSNASEEDQKFFDNKPVPISKWIKYFIFPNVECPVVDNYKDFFENQHRYYCYLMKAPMYNYIPENFNDDPTGATGSLGSKWYDSKTKTRTNWREGDLLQMKKGLELLDRKIH